MTLMTWIAFLATSCAVVAIPGPTAFVVMRHAAERGRIVHIVAGAVLGDAVALTLCNGGLGPLLSASANTMTILEIVAAIYLVGLGITTLRNRPKAAPVRPERGSRPFRSVFLVTAFNPKGIVFFCALLPQFVDGGAPILMQLAILQVTFCVVSLVGATSWSLIGLSLRHASQGPLARRLSGFFLIGAGLSQATRRLA